ncbi:DUF262 domain-containing protein [Actinomadura luteofluorescens]|uniref:DUF262 domain-containing protein n=1 Tax=Actinomadura luteofluorescens TaxID=46163 RepID=UPI0021642E0F|nr:DUF262 domain-containing HNH endonuclease family protein [Actinomadura glauciflava]MCR3738607.1 Protein of unknown function (DUF1524) [Actinomadura glauciflava]
MADPAQFGHDRLAHLLSDRLLSVPKFQRGYAWENANIVEFLEDLRLARDDGQQYFMGTVVLADDHNDPARKIIVDGQQRLTTTAILITAIRDRLASFGKFESAAEIDKKYLKAFDLEEEDILVRLKLNPDNLAAYEELLRGHKADNPKHPIRQCYDVCAEHLAEIAPSAQSYRDLISIITQVEKDVQVLLAVASGLPEAYVIFETLNDRGADLTTADLLKNYLLSQARDALPYIEQKWTQVSTRFEKAEDLVKFIRHEHSARLGKVTTRKLYKALQKDIGNGPTRARAYVTRLEKTLKIYTAIREPDNDYWKGINVEVRDSLMAFRRFGFESSMPLMIAVMTTWDPTQAAKLINRIAGWSVRAWFAGRLGGGTAEEVFSEAAVGVTQGELKNQAQVFEIVKRIVPEDRQFGQAFLAYGSVSTGRAKYILSCLERQRLLSNKTNAEAPPDWSSTSVSVEHIIAQSSKREDFDSQADYDKFLTVCNTISNYTLLERTLNRNLEDSPFVHKRDVYKQSKFALTQELGECDNWSVADASKRAERLRKLALAAWPTL